ncbi:hypothetical protein HK096_008980, partial [Nowakowskiella sp. JEL0078]
MYIYDQANELQHHANMGAQGNTSPLSNDILLILHHVMASNPYSQQFHQIGAIMTETLNRQFTITINADRQNSAKHGKYNVPRADEVALIIVDDGDELTERCPRDVVLKTSDDGWVPKHIPLIASPVQNEWQDQYQDLPMEANDH